MSLTRRRLFERFALGDATPAGEWIAARGREAAVAEGSMEFGQSATFPKTASLIRLASNENPLGPGQHVVDVILGKFNEAGRYPFNAQQREPVLIGAIAKKFGVGNDQVTLGAGSGEILTNAVRAFCSASKPLATPWPTFENPKQTADKMGIQSRTVALDGNLRIDVDKLVEASKGAGLVFFCNPNNPTATLHPASVVADFVKRVRASSPETVILIDEAYHDYVTDPNYQSAIDLVKATPKTFLARTFSKAYGMAGLRVGYAIGHKEQIDALNSYRMPYGINLPAIAAATVALGNQAHIDRERARNTEVKAFVVKALNDLGVKATDSQGNFIFANIGRPATQFREACLKNGVVVGRDFPPYEKTHSRISIGTMQEMQRAVEVFRKVLGSATNNVANRGQ